MKNSVKCKNCSTENPNFAHICSNCKYFLRDRVSNIDIWETIGLLIESPSKAFYKIINSENKNFIIFITLLLAVRIMVLSRFISLVLKDNAESTTALFLVYLISLTSFVFVLSVFTMLSSLFLNKNSFIVRQKDIYSLAVYSGIPHIFAVVLLLPIELIVFGDYLFSNNPNPFQIKSTIAYIFLALEVGIILWSIFLNFISYSVLTLSKRISSLLVVFLISLLTILCVILSNFLFFL